MASDLSPIPDESHPDHPSDKSHLDVLRIAAMSRPLDEVASLAHLLNQTGEQPRPGDEALHMAAVSRPLDEVRELISLLKMSSNPVPQTRPRPAVPPPTMCGTPARGSTATRAPPGRRTP
ncbi:ankyrin repeat domain-containing protein, partial [Streptomyces hundungensis]|uniref:ankyrin repeat domain-containing protein n=1 Tax=Streptomyces hundungensis TaxID=1077946 RepID=UPI0033C2E3A1